MNQQSVLIITDQAEFPRTLMARWQAERSLPAFVLMGSDSCGHAASASHDLAVVGPVRGGRLDSVLAALRGNSRPLLCVLPPTRSLQPVRARHPRVMFVRRREDWAEILVLLGTEILRRVDAVGRACRAEQSAGASERHATIGRYLLDMRHSFNNALTSLLGNAELMLLEPGTLSGELREQVQIMHSMALRIHEIMQRLSSLETEMMFAEKESRGEMPRAVRSVAAHQ